MKRIGLVFLFVLLLLTSLQAERKKVAVVLSGGGAKGMAHIGAIKVIEEAGVPIDFVVGTSMGALIGGLYAVGHDVKFIDSIARSQDWEYLLGDKISRNDVLFTQKEDTEKYLLTINMNSKHTENLRGIIKGHNVQNLLTELTVGYHDTLSFDTLPVQFACVAANILNREEVVFHKGDLVTSMLASMSIPGVFAPVELDSVMLVDGGIVNNYPVDIARSMGADIVIGIDVQAELEDKKRLNTLPGIMAQLINILCLNKYQDNIKITDLHVRPNLEKYTVASFNTIAIDTIINRGEQAMRAHWDELEEIKREVERSSEPTEMYRNVNKFFIKKLTFKGLSKDNKRVRKTVKFKPEEIVSSDDINDAVNTLYGTKMFSAVNYRLIGGPEEYELVFVLKEENSNSLNFGFRFDTEEMAAVLLNTKLHRLPFRSTTLSLTSRLSKNPYLRMDFTLANPFLMTLDASYMFKYNDFNLYSKGDKTNNIVFRYHLGELSYSQFGIRNMNLKVGMRYEMFDYEPALYSDDNYVLDIKSQHFISYYALMQIETLDRKYYPKRGFSLEASYALHTDNFITYDEGTPFGEISANITGVIPVVNRFKIIPSFYGRVLVSHDIPFAYLNYMGGEVAKRYMPQQMTFSGISNLELFDNSLVAAKLTLRQRMGSKHYLSFGGNCAFHNGNFFDILAGEKLFGSFIDYSYDFAAGPVNLTFSMSDWSREFSFYFNLGYYF
ncbi:MAG: patatin-like phospholipase family protein [Culturomica sp.]|jgi:NTE family protein|nr:patatin-like phospholipase family protein [Culturomica sp.]